MSEPAAHPEIQPEVPPESPPESLPDGVLALTILLSGSVGAGISSLAVNEHMREIYDSMGVELPGLLQLAMRLDAPVLCGAGASFSALIVYFVSSGRIRGAASARLARLGATVVTCALLLFAVGARESMQLSITNMQEALSTGGPELPAPSPGEAQALVREVVQAVARGLASSRDGKWSLRGPGGASVEVPLPPAALQETVSFPSPSSERGLRETVQAAPSPSGDELAYTVDLWREEGGLYGLRVTVFRGPPGEDGHRPHEQFETVLR